MYSTSYVKKLIRLYHLKSTNSLSSGCQRVSIGSETKNIYKEYRGMLGPRYRGCLIPFLLLLLHNESSATTYINSEAKDQSVPRVTLPIAYEIRFVPRIDDDHFTFHGESKIAIKVLEKTSNVTLHSRKLWIDENFTSLVDVTGVIRTPKKHSYGNATDFLVIEFDQPIPVGNYTLSLKYGGNYAIGIVVHWYENEKGEKKKYIFSSIYPLAAHTVFPCWNDRDIKATFNLSIKHDANVNATSNMPIRSKTLDTDGNIWTNFDVTHPMAADLLHFFVSDLQCLRNKNEKLSFCGRKEFLSHLKQPLEFTEQAMAFLKKYIGLKYKSPKLDQFVVPETFYEPHRLLYGEKVFMGPDALKTIETGSVTVAQDVSRDILRQWVTMASSNSSWIIEGLSYFLGYRTVDKLHPNWREMDIFLTFQVQNLGFYFDHRTEHKPLSSYDNKWGFQISVRGAAIFHMLSNVLTEPIFDSGIRRFMKIAEYRSVTSDDLWNAMQFTYDEEKRKSNANLPIREIMNSWSDQVGYPIVNVTRDYETGRVTITQKGIVRGHESNRYWIPINFATKSNPNFEKTTPTHWLKPEDECLIIDGIDKDDWIIVNIQLSGYYIVDYDETNWKRIAEYMNSENYQKIHIRNRASLLNDLYSVIWEGRQNFTTYLDIASYLVREDDYLPWFPVNQAIYRFRQVTYDSEVDEPFKKFFLGLADKVLRKIDFDDEEKNVDVSKNKTNSTTTNNKDKFYKDEDFFTKRYRNTFKYLGCNLGHPSCSASVSDNLRAKATYPFEVMPPPNFIWIFCDEIVLQSDIELLNAMRADILNIEYLNYLVCKSDTNALKNFVENALVGESNPSRFQLTSALFYIIEKSNNTLNNTVDYVIKNFDAIVKYIDKTGTAEQSQSSITQILQHCIDISYTFEQTKELLDIVEKMSPRIYSKRTHDTNVLDRSIRRSIRANQMRHDEFSEINQWFRDHSILV